MPIELTMHQQDVKSTMHSKATMVDILQHLASICVIIQTLHTIHKASPITYHTLPRRHKNHALYRHHVGHPLRKATLGFNLCDILNDAHHTESKLYPLGGHYYRHPEREKTFGFKQTSKCCTSYTKQHPFNLQDVKRTMHSKDIMRRRWKRRRRRRLLVRLCSYPE